MNQRTPGLRKKLFKKKQILTLTPIKETIRGVHELIRGSHDFKYLNGILYINVIKSKYLT